MSSIITLVGFSGAGKSVFGKKLATTLNMDFFDLDLVIEEKFHSSIALLFANYGEYCFRKCEAAVLSELLLYENCVIATGGGAPCYENSMDLINSRSKSIYLELSEDILFRNLKESKKRRPLTDNMNDEQLRDYIHKTLLLRIDYYSKAHFKIYSENGDFDIDNILKII